MRYDTPLYFVSEGSKKYDPDTGKYIISDPIKTKKYANVTDMGAERQQVVFGDVSSKRKVVRLQRAYISLYDYIEINGSKYYVNSENVPSDKQSLVVIRNG